MSKSSSVSRRGPSAGTGRRSSTDIEIQIANVTRRSKYPWNEWSDGRIWYLRINTDYTCLVASITSQAHKWSRWLGLAATTRRVSKGVLIQFYPADSTWKPNLTVIQMTRIQRAIDNVR